MIEIVPVAKLPVFNYRIVYRSEGIEYEFSVVGTGINNAAYEARTRLSMKKVGWEILSITKQE